jgi:hypothetical protein
MPSKMAKELWVGKGWKIKLVVESDEEYQETDGVPGRIIGRIAR